MCAADQEALRGVHVRDPQPGTLYMPMSAKRDAKP